ncbi:hypothetical protein DICPUDRAFT_81141 [Dictyostelium purpureum]|uniref:Uncharacterized protein n=1 Tax=Dictyostelium purpureum TaxID=5786 RepID=F0ZSL8_DICPU|nr:uncharacterized protein DICPUDRAFT_81141 [Dictyostelium purpureum]EGC33056.1 hypothetical protein DICPUDRAFT_81141 [Dictyostelium purpureum]|eukprot:XP_003290406.1 hypothetical protein DICPUDRAFT_81141 [Dictyostelium purpureum]
MKTIFILFVIFISCIYKSSGFDAFGSIDESQKNSKPISRFFDYQINYNEESYTMAYTYQNLNEKYNYDVVTVGNYEFTTNYHPWIILNSTTVLLKSEYLLDFATYSDKDGFKRISTPLLSKFKYGEYFCINKYYDDTLDIFILASREKGNQGIFIYNLLNDTSYSFKAGFSAEFDSIVDLYYDINEKMVYFVKTLPTQVFTLNVLTNETKLYNIDAKPFAHGNSFISAYKNYIVLYEGLMTTKLTLYNMETNVASVIFEKDYSYSNDLVTGLNSRYVYLYNSTDNGDGILFDLMTNKTEAFTYTKRNRNLEGYSTKINKNILTAINPQLSYVKIPYDSSYYDPNYNPDISYSNSIFNNINIILIAILFSSFILII